MNLSVKLKQMQQITWYRTGFKCEVVPVL